MSSSHDAIKRVVEAFERSEWSQIDVRSGSLRVHLATTAPGQSAPSQRVEASTAAPTGEPDAAVDRLVGDAGAVAIGVPAGAHLIVSPSPGIYWRAPEPGAPPFVELGQLVEASATVCIVEVMKLMNHVKAGVKGEVVGVYGTDGVAVQRGQALFAIIPVGSSA